MAEPHFTPTQTAMLQVLSDGQPHRWEDLYACLPEGYSSDRTAIRAHLTAIRKVIRPQGQDIIYELRFGASYYRLVRMLASPYDGRR